MSIVEIAKTFVYEQFQTKLLEKFKYHNLEHTYGVLDSVEKLAEIAGLKVEEKELLFLAALFHDTGFTVSPENHEEHSKNIAVEFLAEREFPEEKIKRVGELILSTKMGTEPKDNLEKLMKDADISHIGTEKFKESSNWLREEWELSENRKYTDKEWYKLNFQFLKNTHFYTAAGNQLFGEGKKKNLKALKAMMNQGDSNNKKKDKGKKEKAPDNKPMKLGRGVETMFRVTLRNHNQLSKIADNKANIMLSINAIIISVALTSLLPRLGEVDHLLFPVSLLLAVCVLSIVFATISTIPQVTKGHVTREDISNKKGNLLFFGNFYKMNLEDYQWGMKELMKDDDYLYESLMRDLYFLGKVLYKKYKFLRLTYMVFVIGIVITVIAFIISFGHSHP